MHWFQKLKVVLYKFGIIIAILFNLKKGTFMNIIYRTCLIFVIVSLFAVPGLAQSSASRMDPVLNIYTDLMNNRYGILHVAGYGNATGNRRFSRSQAWLMAKRAARVDAYRQLVTQLPASQNSIQDGEYAVHGFLSGAAVYDEYTSETEKSAFVEMVLFFNVTDRIYDHFIKNGVRIQEISAEEYERIQNNVDFVSYKEWHSWNK
ncbi:MAG: hypothetical protein C4541_08600 [Candidatus Auribacter fodinae]|jgi:hypothetical protein|uniref:Uncharacterized protein n=1 Tax=Candidatus Auribacter fodinae TaxID=2093366 RepID=A0A3A4R5I0_9BACT|nr:MAG: hypothetical protein C4541_08600 [Candidatus Auribacter fodinae]